MMFKKVSLLCLLLLVVHSLADACTLWASLGSANKNAQLLFVKNRDAPLESWQRLQLIAPTHGYRYLALMYKDKPSDTAFTYISAGINQQGLNVANNDINTPIAYSNAVGSHIMQDILRNYSSVAAVLAAKESLFSHSASQNLMIADREQIIMVEIAPGGHYAIEALKQSGYLFHTNHFLNPALIPYNEPISASTFMRYNRIHALLASHSSFDQALFEKFSNDQSTLTADGVIDTNNNILRKVTLATWLVTIPMVGPPSLHLQERNPNQALYPSHLKVRWVSQKEVPIFNISLRTNLASSSASGIDTINLTLDKTFWQQKV